MAMMSADGIRLHYYRRGDCGRPHLGRVCRILLGWIAEPDLDRGDVDGALVDELAFVGAGGHGAELLELVECAFGGVAGFVFLGVERGGTTTVRALGRADGLLVALLGDGGFDPASPQVGADLAVGVRLVGEQPIGSGPGPARPGPGNPQPVHERLKGQRVVTLPGGGHPGQRSTPGV